MNPPLFWPTDRSHRILPVPIVCDDLADRLRHHRAALLELAALADAIRALQDATGHFIHPCLVQSALERCATLLTCTAERLSGPEAEVVALRARALTGEGRDEAAKRQAEIDERELVILCGPIATWARKSPHAYHGFVASVPIVSLNARIAAADRQLSSLQEYLTDLVERPDLTFRPVYRFIATDLAACGGEPSGYPQHFAYFLPEDEGVKGARICKTVVYANVYRMRFGYISRPLAERGLARHAEVSNDDALNVMLLWFRGHDIGHQLRLPGTAFRELGRLGRDRSIALQEALADVLGFLAVAGGPWAADFTGNLDTTSFVFLAELLRYLQRGIPYFPDSEAAALEIAFLLSGGYVEVGPGGRIEWEPCRLREGLTALARELIAGVLGTDLARCEQLLAHLTRPSRAMTNWRSTLHHAAADVPTSLAYDFTH
jgi:hypothetical protein